MTVRENSINDITDNCELSEFNDSCDSYDNIKDDFERKREKKLNSKKGGIKSGVTRRKKRNKLDPIIRDLLGSGVFKGVDIIRKIRSINGLVVGVTDASLRNYIKRVKKEDGISV